MDEGLEPVSLGVSCAVKFQICRRLYLDRFPDGSVQVVREALARGRAGEVFARNVLDWQITPAETVALYLERDFAGVYEREDFVVSPDGEVMHAVLGTRHPHEFHAEDGVLDQAVIDRQYPAARAKFERLAERFRRRLERPGRFLYIQNALPPPDVALRILAQLTARSAAHDARILFADEAGYDLADLDPRIRSVRLAPGPQRPPDQVWEGDADAWDTALAGVRLRALHPFTRSLNRAASAAPQGEPAALDWTRLPQWTSAGALPQVFALPVRPWDYAAMSAPAHPLAAEGPVTLEVVVETLVGDAGVGLISPDGSATIGRETRVPAGEGPTAVSLRLEPGMPPAHILIRNYGYEGPQGSVRLDRVEIRP